MKLLYIIFIQLTILSSCRMSSNSNSSAVIIDKDSTLRAEMSFELNKKFGTLIIAPKDQSIFSSIKSMRACIGEEGPCRVGSGKTWTLVRKNNYFIFPVKISLLRNLKIQVYTQFISKTISETITITDDWSKEIAQKILEKNNTTGSNQFSLNNDFWAQLDSLFGNWDTSQTQPQPYIPSPINPDLTTPNNTTPDIIKPDNTNTQSSPISHTELFNQGPTNHCWGYSTFHALRHYYANSGKNDSEAPAWSAAIQKYNESNDFSSYMGGQVNPSNSFGNPAGFISQFTADNNLPNTWNGGGGYSQAIESLRNGVPSASCDGRHCVAFLSMDQSGTVTVADSSGGYSYQQNSAALSAYQGFLSKSSSASPFFSY